MSPDPQSPDLQVGACSSHLKRDSFDKKTHRRYRLLWEGGGLQLGLEDEKERKSTSCENLMSEELNGANELQ